ncbi:MAG: UDP-N-acetylglucosamine 2-epimerase [Oscillospiraceae bacterium]
MDKTRVMFVTGTRADYGKIKRLTLAVEAAEVYELHLFISGMHLSRVHGSTYQQVLKDGYKNTKLAWGTEDSTRMDVNLAQTIIQLSDYVAQVQPQFLVVHGDRIDALAGAIVCMLNNIRCIHIEGGEVTGTVDDSIRHAISKMAHYHLVSNEEAQIRLQQLGEPVGNIFVIGSPDIDVMLSDDLPPLEQVRERYGIPFERYAIMIYHPVVTEQDRLKEKIEAVVDATLLSEKNYVVIYPNNDLGSAVILGALEKLRANARYRLYRSLDFEEFLVLLRHSEFIIGNSSAGVREACVYGVPCIDVGSRQHDRYPARGLANIIHVEEDTHAILAQMEKIDDQRQCSFYYGTGNSCQQFMQTLQELARRKDAVQKKFVDTSETQAAIDVYINEVLF